MFVWKSEVSLGSIDVLKGSVQESEGSRFHEGLGNKGVRLSGSVCKYFTRLVILFDSSH